jgi:phage terminase Nu1 subunit (DNA packaging protein)
MLPYSAIARFTDISQSTIAYWRNCGYIVDSDDMETIVKSIIAFLRKQIEEKKQENSQKGDKNNYFAEKTRLTSAQADKAELENALRQGELLEATECERLWSAMVASCRARLLAVPNKLAPELAIITDPLVIENRLKSAVYESLWELSKSFEQVEESGESAKSISEN